MAKLTLQDITGSYASVAKLNANFTAIEDALENTLSRDGTTPNQWEATMDANSNTIINLPDALANTSPVTLGQMQNYIAEQSEGLIICLRETATATAGQTVFTFSGITYQPGINNLFVYRNGAKQRLVADYTETSSTSITFTNGLNLGDELEFISNAPTSTVSIDNLVATSKGVYTATGGETTLNIQSLTGRTYLPGSNNIRVYVNGLFLHPGDDFTESSSSTVTLTQALQAGDDVYILVNESQTNNTALATQVAITDTSSYYTSSEVEGALEEAAEFVQSGTGAITRTKLAKLREHVSVKDFGAVGDGVTDDTAAIQAAIDASIYVHFPPGIFISGPLTGRTGLILRGTGGAESTLGGTQIKALTTSTTLLTFTDQPQFMVQDILFLGLSDTVEKGEDVTNIGVYFNNTSAGDIDAVFVNCGFAYFQDCVKIIGRNVRFNNCLFSNSKRGVYIPTGQPADVRGLEMYGCRYHSMGKLAASNEASVYIDPASNFQEIVITGFDADDCNTFLRGFPAMSNISGGKINKARGYGFVVDSTGSGINAERRLVSVSSVSYWQANATTVLGGLIDFTGTFQANLNGLSVGACGGHAFSVNNDYALVADCQAENVGQVTTNTYDAFITTANQVKFRNCQALQSRTAVPANKGRYAFNTPNPIGIEESNIADAGFLSGAFKGLSAVAIPAASGTKVYTATNGGSSGISFLEFYISGQMGGTYTKAIGTKITCSFSLASNTLYDFTQVQSNFGDATGTTLTLGVAAVGSGNQLTFTFTNADATNAFLGNISVKQLNSYGAPITSFV